MHTRMTTVHDIARANGVTLTEERSDTHVKFLTTGGCTYSRARVLEEIADMYAPYGASRDEINHVAGTLIVLF